MSPVFIRSKFICISDLIINQLSAFFLGTVISEPGMYIYKELSEI